MRRRRWQLGRLIERSVLGDHHEAALGRRRAIAKVSPVDASDDDFARFANEVDLLTQAAGTGLIEVLAAGRQHDRLFFVTPRLDRYPSIEGARAARHVLSDVGSALGRLHRLGAAHRDVRPETIWWDGSRPRLGQLGLAMRPVAADRTGGTGPLGAVPFLDPEVVRGRPADAASDLWALGVTAHVLACGRHVFDGLLAHDLGGALDRIATDEPRIDPRIDPALQWAIARCLAPRAERPRDGRALVSAIEEMGARSCAAS